MPTTSHDRRPIVEDRISLEELEQLKERARISQLAANTEKKDPCNRVTATFSMVHEACGFDPIYARTVFTESLKTHDQPYQRRMLVRNEPASLDCSDWVKEPGYLVIENKKGGTEALIYVGNEGFAEAKPSAIFQIAPGHIFAVRLAKDALESLRIWASEDCPASITIMPS